MPHLELHTRSKRRPKKEEYEKFIATADGQKALQEKKDAKAEEKAEKEKKETIKAEKKCRERAEEERSGVQGSLEINREGR